MTWAHLEEVAESARWSEELVDIYTARAELHSGIERDLNQMERERRAPKASERRSIEARFRDIDRIDNLIRSAGKRFAEMRAKRAELAPVLYPDVTDRRGFNIMRKRNIDPELDALIHGEVRSINLDMTDVIAERRERRDLTKGVAAAGGNTVPTSFRARLWEMIEARSAVLSAGAQVITTAGGESIDLPRVSSYGTATATSEGSAIAESDPAFAKDTIGSFKYANITQVSRELLEDSGVDLEGFLARHFAVATDKAVGPMWVSGTGTTQPRGVVFSAGTGHTGGTGLGGAPSYDDLVETMYALDREYRPGAAWMMADSAAKAIRKLKDADGTPIWQNSMQAGEPDRLFGYPIYVDPYMAAVGTGVQSIVFGDLSTFIVRLAGGGLRIDRSNEYAFANDLITWRSVLRTDSLLHDVRGVTTMRGGTA